MAQLTISPSTTITSGQTVNLTALTFTHSTTTPIYRASLRTTRMDSVEADIDSGAGAATVEIGDAGFATVLAIFTASDPAGTVSGDVLTFASMPKSTTGLATGVAAEGRIKNSTGTVIVSGLTVGV
jgi:hypothetical protein